MNPSAIARVLGAGAFLLGMASIIGTLKVYILGEAMFPGLVRLINLDLEQSVPNFFSAALLLIAALLPAIIALLKKKQLTPYVAHWAILSLGLLYLPVDEACALHEMLIRPTRWLLAGATMGVFHNAWIIPAIAVLIPLAMFFRKFLLHLTPKTRRAFVMAAGLFLGGSIGIEIVEGRQRDLHELQAWTYTAMVNIEESLEMAGPIVIIWRCWFIWLSHSKS